MTASAQVQAEARRQLDILCAGAAEVISREDLRGKLETALAAGRPLRVKLGADPSAPDLHLGHTVVLNLLRRFQDQGHTAIFLIGDFTGMIGDPTGKSETRKPLTRDEVRLNAETYKQQIFKVLDPARTEIRLNSEWLDALTFGASWRRPWRAAGRSGSSSGRTPPPQTCIWATPWS